ncbi:hypothetical protein OJAV_G00053390 [Oryzias javanicus]|uniref:Uncharacterized protein n=1 Tax=Oryzias javanicus TaxID=123683 RepID=A0A3S2PNL8_ORYJA|nr:hypothetical protein OJAV_G00053390 [Oryzias javanicus]
MLSMIKQEPGSPTSCDYEQMHIIENLSVPTSQDKDGRETKHLNAPTSPTDLWKPKGIRDDKIMEQFCSERQSRAGRMWNP